MTMAAWQRASLPMLILSALAVSYVMKKWRTDKGEHGAEGQQRRPRPHRDGPRPFGASPKVSWSNLNRIIRYGPCAV